MVNCYEVCIIEKIFVLVLSASTHLSMNLNNIGYFSIQQNDLSIRGKHEW